MPERRTGRNCSAPRWPPDWMPGRYPVSQSRRWGVSQRVTREKNASGQRGQQRFPPQGKGADALESLCRGWILPEKAGGEIWRDLGSGLCLWSPYSFWQISCGFVTPRMTVQKCCWCRSGRNLQRKNTALNRLKQWTKLLSPVSDPDPVTYKKHWKFFCDSLHKSTFMTKHCRLLQRSARVRVHPEKEWTWKSRSIVAVSEKTRIS